MIALRELQCSWPISGWVISLLSKNVRGNREEGDLQPGQILPSRLDPSPDSRRQQDDGKNTFQFQDRGSSDFPSASTEIQEGYKAAQSQGTAVGSNAETTVTDGKPLLNRYQAPIPLDFSTDWSDVCEEDLWIVPELTT